MNEETRVKLEQVKPEEAGFNTERLRRVDSLLANGVKEGFFPCAVYLLARGTKVFATGAFGNPQPDTPTNGVPHSAGLDTIFDLASITKTFTGVLLLQATQEGLLHLGLKVQDILPEAASSSVVNVTLTQLATHTSGLPPWKPLYRATDALSTILETPLDSEPGTRYAYSDLGYVLLTKILETVFSKSFDRIVLERIIAPLELMETHFNPFNDLHPRIAATANCPLREGKILVGEVHDANAFSMGGVSGHAGLFSTVTDIAKYLTGLPQLLAPLALKKAYQSQIAESVGGHSIGWFTSANAMLPSGDFLSEHCFGHTGFTGTMAIQDRDLELTLILLTNRVYTPRDATSALRVRRYFSNLVAAAFMG